MAGSFNLSTSVVPAFAAFRSSAIRGRASELALKSSAVDSTGERNTLRKLSARRDEAKRFPRPCVEFQRHGVEIGLTVN